MWYILDDDNKPVAISGMVFNEWITANPLKKLVKQEYVNEVWVSTVFLGLDHSYVKGKPILWETMIFEGSLDVYQERYTSHEEALTGHEFAVQMVKNDILKQKQI